LTIWTSLFDVKDLSLVFGVSATNAPSIGNPLWHLWWTTSELPTFYLDNLSY
jgi:hypothetical protein